MLNTFQTFDFQVLSEKQIENFKLLQDNLKKKDCLKHPILKINIRLQNLRLLAGFRKFFIDPPNMDYCHPP